jgi:hypothetical protein
MFDMSLADGPSSARPPPDMSLTAAAHRAVIAVLWLWVAFAVWPAGALSDSTPDPPVTASWDLDAASDAADSAEELDQEDAEPGSDVRARPVRSSVDGADLTSAGQLRPARPDRPPRRSRIG